MYLTQLHLHTSLSPILLLRFFFNQKKNVLSRKITVVLFFCIEDIFCFVNKNYIHLKTPIHIYRGFMYMIFFYTLTLFFYQESELCRYKFLYVYKTVAKIILFFYIFTLGEICWFNALLFFG